MTLQKNNWWKEAVIYQIYPRSFKDDNNDGIGDLKGITSKVEYLKNLGIDIVWLSPHFKSPNVDNGYDIADYCAIMSDFGTMEDFDEMLNKLHQNGIKLIIDLVVNHSSSEHEWFKQALENKDSSYRNYYIWQKEIPNNWISFFSGSAWELDEKSNEYYLHLFDKKQPDLNWENPQLRDEVYNLMKFWLDKGVDGFRMDVISLIAKPTNFQSFPNDRTNDLTFYASNPKVHEYLQEMNKAVLSPYNCVTVGEAFGVSAEESLKYVGDDRGELNMIYHFDHAVPRDENCFINPAKEFSLLELKQIFNKWDKALENDGWNTIYFGNHDNPRVLSRFGNITNFREASAKMLATVLLTLRGTPFIYQGDEIGMSNAIFNHINEFNDVQVHNAYNALVVNKNEEEQIFIDACNKIARDHARTPMQWNHQTNAGFTNAAKPWLKVNENYTSVNVEFQEKNDTSILNYYKTLIKIRKQHKVFIYGKYTDLTLDNNNVWAYTRIFENQKALVLHNFTAHPQQINLLDSYSSKQLILSNYDEVMFHTAENVYDLKPYQSIIYLYQ
jgi:oligo-1,6-glucosidase